MTIRIYHSKWIALPSNLCFVLCLVPCVLTKTCLPPLQCTASPLLMMMMMMIIMVDNSWIHHEQCFAPCVLTKTCLSPLQCTAWLKKMVYVSDQPMTIRIYHSKWIANCYTNQLVSCALCNHKNLPLSSAVHSAKSRPRWPMTIRMIIAGELLYQATCALCLVPCVLTNTCLSPLPPLLITTLWQLSRHVNSHSF